MPVHVNGFDVTPLNSRVARNLRWRHVAPLDADIVIPDGVTIITIFNTESTPVLFAKGDVPDPEAVLANGDVTSAGLLIEAGKAAVMPVAVIPQQNIRFKAVAETPAGGATEGTLAQLLAVAAPALTDNPLAGAPAMPVRPTPQQFTDCSFIETGANVPSAYMDLIGTVGSGMAVNQTGGNLVLTSGVTPNSETVIRSKATFNGALLLRAASTLSQRIVNNNFFVELVDIIGDNLPFTIINATTVDVGKPAHGFHATQSIGQRMDIGLIAGATGIPMEAVIASIPDANTIRFTVAGWPASGSGTCSLWGFNKIELLYTGATATSLNFKTRRRGYQNTSTAVTINTTASGHMAIVNAVNGAVAVNDQTLAIGVAATPRSSWETNIPLPDVPMVLQLRAKNGTAAPATTTTWTIAMWRVEDYVQSRVEIGSITPHGVRHSLPVSVQNSLTVASATLAASVVRMGFVAGAGIWYDDSSTTLAASATFTGTSRDATLTATATAFANAATYAQEVRVIAESDVTGTLWLEVSRDGTNWRRTRSVATAAIAGGGFAAEIIYRPAWRYWRAGYTNGAGAQARFALGTLAMAA